MISISERLRARQEPVGDGSGKWRKDGLCQEAADTIDALVAALEEAQPYVGAYESEHMSNVALAVMQRADAALAKAKGKQE